MRFQNGANKVVIELRAVKFWSEIIFVISNQTCAERSFDFEITRMISDLIKTITKFSNVIGYQQPDLSINNIQATISAF